MSILGLARLVHRYYRKRVVEGYPIEKKISKAFDMAFVVLMPVCMLIRGRNMVEIVYKQIYQLSRKIFMGVSGVGAISELLGFENKEEQIEEKVQSVFNRFEKRHRELCSQNYSDSEAEIDMAIPIADDEGGSEIDEKYSHPLWTKENLHWRNLKDACKNNRILILCSMLVIATILLLANWTRKDRFQESKPDFARMRKLAQRRRNQTRARSKPWEEYDSSEYATLKDEYDVIDDLQDYLDQKDDEQYDPTDALQGGEQFGSTVGNAQKYAKGPVLALSRHGRKERSTEASFVTAFVNGLFQENTHLGCCHVMSCPVLTLRGTSNSNRVCNIKCGGQHCIHWSTCSPPEPIIPNEKVLEVAAKIISAHPVLPMSTEQLKESAEQKQKKSLKNIKTVCYNCNEQGHPVWACPHPRQVCKNYIAGKCHYGENCWYAHRAIYENPCGNCQQKGHETKNCPQKDKHPIQIQKEAMLKGPRFYASKIANSVGWMVSGMVCNIVMMWNHILTPLHAFNDAGNATLKFWVDGKIEQWECNKRDGFQIHKDVIAFRRPDKFKGVPCLGDSSVSEQDMLTNIAWDDEAKFSAKSESSYQSVLIRKENDNGVVQNSTQRGCCGSPYVNQQGKVVGWHNASDQTANNYFIMVTADMKKKLGMGN